MQFSHTLSHSHRPRFWLTSTLHLFHMHLDKYTHILTYAFTYTYTHVNIYEYEWQVSMCVAEEV